MEIWFLFLAWTVLALLVGIGLGIRYAAALSSNKPVSKNDEFEKLRRSVETPNNKIRVNDLIQYHNNRIKNGAIVDESYQRLLNDLQYLKDNPE